MTAPAAQLKQLLLSLGAVDHDHDVETGESIQMMGILMQALSYVVLRGDSE